MRGEVSDNARRPGVGVMRVHGEYRLLSVAHFQPGELLFEIAGEITRTPTRYTVQIDQNAHIDLNDSHNIEEILDRYCWRFMNHSCEPNTVIRGRNVVALRPIRPWEEITFNYNTTEYQMAEPFQCLIERRCVVHGEGVPTRPLSNFGGPCRLCVRVSATTARVASAGITAPAPKNNAA